MMTQHYQRGYTIKQVSRFRYEVIHDGVVLYTMPTLRMARGIIKDLLKNTLN